MTTHDFIVESMVLNDRMISVNILDVYHSRVKE